jgi:FkbM family methyltransferase
MSDIMSFLSECKGVIHCGGSKAQERKIYHHYNLDVLWLEALPSIFEVLKARIAHYPKQKGFCACITDKDNEDVTFHLINRSGLSSSIYELAEHKKVHPNVHENGTLKLKTTTLNTLIKTNNLDINMYDSMVIDVQGAELCVLKGVDVKNLKYIMLEVADFEAYRGCCQLKDIEAFMKENNFVEKERVIQNYTEGVGSYWDILYQKV